MPTNAPSGEPSVSNAPTALIFVTADSGEGRVSTCEATPPSSGTTQEQTLAFQYNLYITPQTNAADAVNTMETKLHSGMAQNFLVCDFGDVDAAFHIVSINSSPDDTVLDSEACITSNDPTPSVGTICVVVNAEMTMQAYFPSRRKLQETDADPDVLDESADYLEASMANGDFAGGYIVQVSFQGFLNVKQERETPPAGVGGDVAGVIGGETLQPANGNSNVVVGSAVIAVAAMCLMVVTVLSVRYRNSRRSAYLHHLEELSHVSDLDAGGEKLSSGTLPLSSDGKVELVMQDDYEVDSFDEAMDYEIRHHHDVHNCASATCPVCRNRELQPTFISTDYGNQEILADLSDLRVGSFGGKRSYRTSDTVDL
jgi:hypothetical protein